MHARIVLTMKVDVMKVCLHLDYMHLRRSCRTSTSGGSCDPIISLALHVSTSANRDDARCARLCSWAVRVRSTILIFRGKAPLEDEKEFYGSVLELTHFIHFVAKHVRENHGT